MILTYIIYIRIYLEIIYMIIILRWVNSSYFVEKYILHVRKNNKTRIHIGVQGILYNLQIFLDVFKMRFYFQ